MPAEKMHKGEVDTDAASLGRRLANQFPQWADLPIEPVAWSGGERTAALVVVVDTIDVVAVSKPSRSLNFDRIRKAF